MKPKELKHLRETLGITQQELADYLGLKHRSQVLHLESGRTKISGSKLKLLVLLKDRGRKIFEKIS